MFAVAALATASSASAVVLGTFDNFTAGTTYTLSTTTSPNPSATYALTGNWETAITVPAGFGSSNNFGDGTGAAGTGDNTLRITTSNPYTSADTLTYLPGFGVVTGAEVGQTVNIVFSLIGGTTTGRGIKLAFTLDGVAQSFDTKTDDNLVLWDAGANSETGVIFGNSTSWRQEVGRVTLSHDITLSDVGKNLSWQISGLSGSTGFGIDNWSATVVPEPSSALLGGLGLLALLRRRRA